MKLFTSAVALCMLIGSSLTLAANGNGPGAAEAVAPQQNENPPMEQEMFGQPEDRGGQPEIAGDGIQNATQVENPTDIGNKSSTAQDSPEPIPTVGDVGEQKAK
ncbi:MAG: hypothetical protein QNJ78_07490 [Gammaproteobacteria bacterium]|nr:hypothetical protein [Gammaproteobacteria bacterium]